MNLRDSSDILELMVNINFAKFLPSSPPSDKLQTYYVRLVGLRAGSSHYGVPSESVRIEYKTDSSNTKFTDVDKGEFHPSSVTVMKHRTIPKAEVALIAAGLMENDEGLPKSIVRRVHDDASEGPQIVVWDGGRDGAASRYTKKVGSLLRAEAEHQEFKVHSVDNRDDYVGAKELPLTDDLLRRCRTTKAWHKKSPVIAGDGGRYRLDFAIKADPK